MNTIQKKTIWLLLLWGLSGVSYQAIHSSSSSISCLSQKSLRGTLGSITKGLFSFFTLYAMQHSAYASQLEEGIHTIGSSGLRWDTGPSLIVDEDRSIWIASTVSIEGNMSSHFFLSEIDRSGEVGSYALVNEDIEVSYDVAKSSNSTLTLLGKTYHSDNHTWDVMLASFNTTSYLTERVWLKANDTHEMMSFIPTNEGDLVMVGYIDINGSEDLLVTRLDATRNITWLKALGGYDQERGTSISIGTNNSLRTVGYTHSYGQTARWLLVHLDEAGEEISTKTIRGDKPMYPEEIVAHGEGCVVIGSQGSVGNETLVIAKFKANDTLQWAKAMPSASGRSVAVHEDGTIAIKAYLYAHGTESGTIVVAQFSPIGILQSTQAFVGRNSTKGRSVATTPEGDTLVADLTDAETHELLLAKIPRHHTEGCEVPIYFDIIDITASVVVEDVSLNVSYPNITINVSYAQAVPLIIEKNSLCLFTQNPTPYPTTAPIERLYESTTTTTSDPEVTKDHMTTIVSTIGLITTILLCYAVAFYIVICCCPNKKEENIEVVNLRPDAKYRINHTAGKTQYI